MAEIKWEKSLTKKDLEAAKEFLTLLFEPKEVQKAVAKLKKHKDDVIEFKAKDVLRASDTQLLPETNKDVRSEFVKMVKGKPLVPVSLVRLDRQLFIADGYHRTCAAYYLDKDSQVHCVLIGIGDTT